MARAIHWERNEDPVGIWEHRGKVCSRVRVTRRTPTAAGTA